MRSKEDWCASYILDDSAVSLIKRNKRLCEDWFLEAVDCDFDEDVVSPENDRAEDSGVSRKKESSTGDGSLDSIAEDYFG
jgi:hypothetical protein